MPSIREQSVNDLFVAINGITGPVFKRNEPLPTKIPTEGLVIVRDGEIGEPEIILSPTRYIYRHMVEIEVLVQEADQATRDTVLDALIQQIGNAIELAGTLNGVVDNIQPTAPEFVNEIIDGAPTVKAAVIGVILEYVTRNPLK